MNKKTKTTVNPECLLFAKNNTLICEIDFPLEGDEVDVFCTELKSFFEESSIEICDLQILPVQNEQFKAHIQLIVPEAINNVKDIVKLSEWIMLATHEFINVVRKYNDIFKQCNNEIAEILRPLNDVCKDFTVDMPTTGCDFEKPAKKEDHEESAQNQNSTKNPRTIAAILYEVGTNRSATVLCIKEFLGINYVDASAKYFKVATKDSASEFLGLFTDSNKANDFMKQMEKLGNKILLQG